MIEPSLAFQTAARAALIADPRVVALVDANNICSGGRPDTSPVILLGDAQTQLLGHAAGGQHVARVFLTLHVWALEDGSDTGKRIGFALLQALARAPATDPDFEIDVYLPPAIAWMRDPQPEAAWTHGILELGAVLRWRD